MTENHWQDWGLEPFTPLAPPWSHVVGHSRLVVVRYDWQSTTHARLSEHWHVDTTVATGTGDATLQRGDLVVCVGRDDEDDTDLVWPPSVVVRAGARRQGRQRVSSLTFTDHEAELLADLPDDLVAVLREDGVVDAVVRRRLLGLWHLDVLCPECGGFGVPISWGMPPPPEVPGESSGPPSPDDPGQACILGGCVVSSERFVCGRCGHQWPNWDEGWA